MRATNLLLMLFASLAGCANSPSMNTGSAMIEQSLSAKAYEAQLAGRHNDAGNLMLRYARETQKGLPALPPPTFIALVENNYRTAAEMFESGGYSNAADAALEECGEVLFHWGFGGECDFHRILLLSRRSQTHSEDKPRLEAELKVRDGLRANARATVFAAERAAERQREVDSVRYKQEMERLNAYHESVKREREVREGRSRELGDAASALAGALLAGSTHSPGARQVPYPVNGGQSARTGRTQTINVPNHRTCISPDWNKDSLYLVNQCAMPLNVYYCLRDTCSVADSKEFVASTGRTMISTSRSMVKQVKIFQACSLRNGEFEVTYSKDTGQCRSEVRIK